MVSFPGDTVLKNCLPMQETQETQVQPWLGKIPWKRKGQPTPVFLPETFHGHRSLAGCMESQRVMTEQLTLALAYTKQSWTQHTHTHTHTPLHSL